MPGHILNNGTCSFSNNFLYDIWWNGIHRRWSLIDSVDKNNVICTLYPVNVGYMNSRLHVWSSQKDERLLIGKRVWEAQNIPENRCCVGNPILIKNRIDNQSRIKNGMPKLTFVRVRERGRFWQGSTRRIGSISLSLIFITTFLILFIEIRKKWGVEIKYILMNGDEWNSWHLYLH